MNIDSLPFTDFAPESRGAAAQATGAGRTLTLQLELGPLHHPLVEPMTGSAFIAAAGEPSLHALHAAVVPVRAETFRITFEL